MRNCHAYAVIMAVLSACALPAPCIAGQNPRLELSVKQGIVMVLENNLDITIGALRNR